MLSMVQAAADEIKRGINTCREGKVHALVAAVTFTKWKKWTIKNGKIDFLLRVLRIASRGGRGRKKDSQKD